MGWFFILDDIRLVTLPLVCAVGDSGWIFALDDARFGGVYPYCSQMVSSVSHPYKKGFGSSFKLYRIG